jgi:hypothetical protein
MIYIKGFISSLILITLADRDIFTLNMSVECYFEIAQHDLKMSMYVTDGDTTKIIVILLISFKIYDKRFFRHR